LHSQIKKIIIKKKIVEIKFTVHNSSLFNEFVCNLGFFGTRGPLKLSFHSSFKLAHSCQKKPKLHKNELNTTFFCSTSPPKGSKSLKIYKISLTFCFDKLSNLSKSVHTGENSQILTVLNKKKKFFDLRL
jgi:hypothetical protein